MQLLDWMQHCDFRALVESGLLERVEQLVVEEHRAVHAALLREKWSEPIAYHWLHYEDRDPVARLRDGTIRLAAQKEQLLAREELEAERAAAFKSALDDEAHSLDAVLEIANRLGYRESPE